MTEQASLVGTARHIFTARSVAIRSMSLRARIALLAAAAVAVAIVASAFLAYTATRGQLRSGIDESLQRFATYQGGQGFDRRRPVMGGAGAIEFAPPPEEIRLVAHFVSPSGDVLGPRGVDGDLPVTSRDLAVARGQAPGYLHDARFAGTHWRVITTPAAIGPGFGPGQSGALLVARPLTEVDNVLRGLFFILLLVTVGGVGLAAALGLVVARSALQPIGKLTEAAEHVARTQDLGAAIDVDRSDEIGRLARSFNEMLAALASSREQQQRLVADASHELRTPLTSLRTNIEVLQRVEQMDEAERARVLADLNVEVEELSNLVGELVDLATAPGGADEPEADVHLDAVVEQVVDRARRRSGQTIDLNATPTIVRARPAQIERAVANIVDNACKWNALDDPIKVRVSDGTVEVTDQGPGIDADDLPYVFDRFYRAPAARSLPGSGLGLAIVKQIVESHGGRVWAKAGEETGAVVGFELPVSSE